MPYKNPLQQEDLPQARQFQSQIRGGSTKRPLVFCDCEGDTKASSCSCDSTAVGFIEKCDRDGHEYPLVMTNIAIENDHL